MVVTIEVVTVVKIDSVLTNFNELSLLVEVVNDGVLADIVNSFALVDPSFVAWIVDRSLIENWIFVTKVDSVDEVMEECEDDSLDSVRSEVITVVENVGVNKIAQS